MCASLEQLKEAVEKAETALPPEDLFGGGWWAGNAERTGRLHLQSEWETGCVWMGYACVAGMCGGCL